MSEPPGAPTGAPPLRVLVVDDEPLARRRLLDLLAREPDVEVAGAVGTGRQAVELVRQRAAEGRGVDVVFLDVQMPGLTGLDVVRALGPHAVPAVVFVTAHDRHALDAFELAALDYLLKPFDNERFSQALGRAREAVRLREVGQLQARLVALLGGGPAPPPARTLERIAVEGRGQTRVVAVADVDYVTAEGTYVALHVGPETHVVRDTLGALEERLDPAVFFRVHRSAIVRLDRIEALLTAPGGDYAVRLRGGARLKVARARRDALAERLGLGA